jgi:hypothetical protein
MSAVCSLLSAVCRLLSAVCWLLVYRLARGWLLLSGQLQLADGCLKPTAEQTRISTPAVMFTVLVVLTETTTSETNHFWKCYSIF